MKEVPERTSAEGDRHAPGWRVGSKLLLLTLPLIAALTALAVWIVQARTLTGLHDKLAQRSLILHTQIMANRQYYASVVVPRVKDLGGTFGEDYSQVHGRFPLPATFVREVSELTTKIQKDYTASLISPWPINPGKGVKDQFQRDAFAYLAEHPTGQFVRTDTVEGRVVMRALMGDHATAQSCVDCHNAHPKSPKHDFKLNDLMGGLEVAIPIDQYVEESRRDLILTLAGGTGLCLLITGVVVLGTRRLVTRPLAGLIEKMRAFAEGERGASSQAEAALSGDEIARLNETFEAMSETIAHQENELRDANARLEQRVLERTEALQSLVGTSQLVTTETSLARFLQESVETARRLTRARYAALGVFDETGERLVQFLTAGMDEAVREAIGCQPAGLDLLGRMAHKEGVLRLKDLAQHPVSVDFPLRRPPMRSFLGTSIQSRGRLYGRLFVTDKQGADEFTALDEQAILGLAAHAGAAIENALFIKELQSSREQHRATIAALPVSIVRLGQDRTIRFANRVFYDLVRRRPEDTMGRPIGDVLPVKGLEEYLRTMQATHGGGGIGAEREFECVLPPDGSAGLTASDRRILRVNVSWIRRTTTDSDDDIVFAIEDVTERKEAEAAAQEKEMARLSAEHANKAKSEFLSRMSHELRTPLNAILGFAQLLEMDPLSTEQQEHVRHILKGGRHLLALINEVLDIARIEAGRLTLSLEPVPVPDVIREAVDLVRPQAAARKIQLVTPSNGGEIAHVRADRQRLKQVLLNLLSNGVKYNREGGTLTVSCQAVPEHRYRITVTDTGGGIPAALMARLFTPFDRLEADARTEGTGLGLVVSRSLITAMGGTMSVDSVVSRGTSVSIELPLSEPPTVRAEPVSDKVQVTAPVSGDALTVLYIEDNLSNYQLVECLVERRPGIRLLSAMQGKLGVELAASHHPDLVLLDLNLPDMQGDEVLLRLRENPETAGIPVVMLSADAMPKQIDKLLAAGARGYLTKPIEVAKFYAVLDELMIQKGGR